MRSNILDGGKQEMRAVDVGIQRRKFIVKRIAYEALGSQVVALVGHDLGNCLIDTGKALQ